MLKSLTSLAVALATISQPATAAPAIAPREPATAIVPADSPYRQRFACYGKLIDQSAGPRFLVVVSGFRDGTVKDHEPGPLNDRNDFTAAQALAAFGSSKLLVTRTDPRVYPGAPQPYERALAIAEKDRVVVWVEAEFASFDQRIQDRSRSLNFFVLGANASYARDRSQNALTLRVMLTQDGASLGSPRAQFSFKSIMESRGKRIGVGVYTDDLDLNATIASASSQSIGDVESLLIDLAALSTVRALFGIDLDRCKDASSQDAPTAAGTKTPLTVLDPHGPPTVSITRFYVGLEWLRPNGQSDGSAFVHSETDGPQFSSYYPLPARRAGRTERVELICDVSAQGRATKCDAAAPAEPDFVSAATKLVLDRAWFEPQRRAGRYVTSKGVPVSVIFSNQLMEAKRALYSVSEPRPPTINLEDLKR